MKQITLDALATTRAIERSAGHLYTFIDEHGRHGPYPGVTAITRLQDSLSGSDGLMGWAVGLALDEVWNGVNGLRAWSRADDQERAWEALRSAAFQAKNKPADIGNAVHSEVDNFNRNLPLGLNEVTAPYLAHYGAVIYNEGIEIHASERYVVNTDIGFGGTYDSLVSIADRETGDVETGPMDVKTGKEKPSQRLQLTGLSMGQWHGEAGLEAERMPKLDSVGWILLLRPDGYDLIRHEITDADRDHFTRLVEVYHRIRQWQEEA